MKKKVFVKDIIDYIADDVIGVQGLYAGCYIDNLSDSENVNETSLDWINPSKQNKQDIAQSSKAKVLLVDQTIKYVEGKVLIMVRNPKVSLAQVGNHFFVSHPTHCIHPTAIIDSNAKIGNNVNVGPYSVIGNAVIGDNCFIDSNVRVYDYVQIGCNCNIKSGAVLGGAGFGYQRDNEGNYFRFPQIGHLIMGDNVEVGSNTVIDRGALSDTVIGSYTKINNLCHIAHNNRIGRNVIITGGVIVAGGNVIDDYVWIAPNSAIKGYVHIGEHAFVGMSSVVVKNIPAGETWVGNPAHKFEHFR